MTVGLLTNTKGRLVPLQNTLRRTKQLDITAAVTADLAGWVTARATAIFYMDSNNVWRMNIAATGYGSESKADNTAVKFTISGVWFKNFGGFHTPVAARLATATSSLANAASVGQNSNYIYVVNRSGSTQTITDVMIAGDVELNGEPTTYTTTANLENYQDVTAWIPNADTSTAGLLTYYATGTFTFYVNDGTGVVSAARTAYYTRIGNQVTVQFGQAVVQSTVNTRFITTTNSTTVKTWPAHLTPTSVTVPAIGVAREDGNNTACSITISSAGTVTIYANLNQGAFTANNATKGIDAFTMTYLLN